MVLENVRGVAMNLVIYVNEVVIEFINKQKRIFMSKIKLVSKLTEFVNTKSDKKITHGHVGIWDDYPCANPDGAVDNSECDEDDPLCNCPCQELKPNSEEEVERINTENIPDNITSLGDFADLVGDLLTGELEEPITSEDLTEPTDEEIEEAKKSIKECELIKEHLNEDWLGCLWNDLEHPSSCNCPCVGKRFSEYLDYTRTYSTYWNSPPEQKLWRNAQMLLISSQKSAIQIHGDLTLRPGTLIYIKDKKLGKNKNEEEKRIGGRWLVAGISHQIGGSPIAHSMTLDLIRDTQTNDPNGKVESGFSIWDRLMGLLT